MSEIRSSYGWRTPPSWRGSWFIGRCNSWNSSKAAQTYLDNAPVRSRSEENTITISDSSYFEYITPSSNYNIDSRKGNRLDVDQDIATSWVAIRTDSYDVDTYDGHLDGEIIKIIPARSGRNFKVSLLTDIKEEINFLSVEDPNFTLKLSDGTSISPKVVAYYDIANPDEDVIKGLFENYRYSIKGTCKILKLANNPTIVGNKYGAYCLKRSIAYPYGGYTNSARTNSTYIACSDSINYNTTSIDVYGGDTFITFFEQLRGFSINDKDADGNPIK